MRPRSTRRAAPATRLRSCTSCSPGRSARTTCPTARTCATRRAACALIETIGIGKGSVHITDFAEADLIVVVGQNPGTNHPRMLSTLEDAKRQGAVDRRDQPAARGRPDPLQEPAATERDAPARARSSPTTTCRSAINGDLAFFKAVNHLLARRRPADGTTGSTRAFIDEHTSGFAEFAAAAADFDWDVVRTGDRLRPRRSPRRFAERVRRSERIIVCWAMGLTQHANSVATIREVVNLLLLRGNIGRPGAGVCPVRGHSNVQGDRTMGIYEQPSDRRSSTCSAERVRLRAAACARARHRRHDPGDARRRGHGLHGHGRQLRVGDARHGR